jgi:hypothetical protein
MLTSLAINVGEVSFLMDHYCNAHSSIETRDNHRKGLLIFTR